VKIYTRRGDAGETDLLGGGRVAKDGARVEAYGAVDELNAQLGAAAAISTQPDLRDLAREIQEKLFALGAHLASPDEARRERAAIPGVGDADVEALEKRIDALESELAPLRRFILPGGSPAAAGFHLARTVCRRAERRAVTLQREEPLSPVALRYLNRLSDLLFVLARVENRRADVPDVEWEGRGGA
jgi:cob(I)alamin adenosyltransferase